MKEIVFFYSRYSPSNDGVSNAAKSLAEALTRTNVTVIVMVPRNLRSNLAKREYLNGVLVWRVSGPWRVFDLINSIWPNAYTTLTGLYFGILLKVSGKSPDLLFGHNLQYGGTLAVNAGKILSVRTAVMVHGEDVNQLLGKARKELISSYVLENIDHVFSTNTDFSNILTGIHKRSYQALPNIFTPRNETNLSEGLLLKRFNQGKLNLVCIGRLDRIGNTDLEIKGFSIALSAMKKLSNVKLKIIGQGILFKTYEDFIQCNNLENQVQLLGRIEFDEVQNILNSASAVLLPSNIEGLSMVMLETMSKGLPLLATEIAGAKDYIINGENGYLFDVGDVNGLVNAITDLSLNYENYKVVSENSLATYKDNFTGARVAKKLFENLNW